MKIKYGFWVGAGLLAAYIVATSGCKSEKAASTTQPAADQPKQLNVYMYSEYIDPAIPEAFAKQTGIKVRVDVYEATEEMMAKLQHAGGKDLYDVVVVSDHAIPVLAQQRLIQPIDTAQVPNAKHIGAKFRNPPYDPEGKYSLPYQWGTMGLMYRKDKIENFEPTWALLFDESKQPGPFVLIDSMRDMFAAALKFQGKSINTRSLDELKAAGELILKAKASPKMVGFEGGVGGTKKVASGDAVLAVVYNGDALRAIDEDESGQLDYAIPAEGSLIWMDAMTVTAGSKHIAAAHAFMNYILDPEVGAKLSNFNRYGTPNEASMPMISEEDRANPGIYPEAEVMQKLEYLEDLGEATRLYDEIWTAVKSR